jgi:hypothetical protein
MNNQHSLSGSSLHIHSTKKSLKASDGSITTNGGIGIGKNLCVNDEIIAGELISRTNLKVGENIYVPGEVYANKIIPINSLSIGTNTKKVDECFIKTINSNKIITKEINMYGLDVTNEVSLCTNDNGQPIIYIGHTVPNTMIINGNIIILNNNREAFININQNNEMNINGNLNCNNLFIENFITIKPQTIKKISDFIEINSSIVLLEINSVIITTLKINSDFNNILCKIILKKKKNKENTITINYNTDSFNLLNIGDYIELLYSNNNFEYISGNIKFNVN